MSVSKDLVKILKESDKKGTEPYDTEATVKRIDGSTAWVHIPGGVDETPVQLTIGSRVGDKVQVRVSGGRAWLVGNASSPPTDDMMAIQASNTADEAGRLATTANEAAQNAVADAGIAREAAESAIADAGRAQESADNASEYAARALGNLSTVQSVTETLNWITAHGTMTLTTDQQLDPTHVYFVVDPNGDYVVGSTHYSVVSIPDVADISTYYELSIDESLNNYVGTHLAVTSEGLWLLPDAGGNKVLIAVGGQGHTYETAGTYIIGKVNNVDTVFAKFLSNGATMMAENGTQIAHLGYGKTSYGGNIVIAPYYTLGTRIYSSQAYDPTATYSKGDLCAYNGEYWCCRQDITTPEAWNQSHWAYYIGRGSVVEGNSVASNEYAHAEGVETRACGGEAHAEGYNTRATGYASHAEGNYSKALDSMAHAEGDHTIADGSGAHAEGEYTTAEGPSCHAQNQGTIAYGIGQTSIGKYNKRNANGDLALIIGNGTANNARSNALTVDWSGDVQLALDTTSSSGTDHDLYAAIVALGWQSEVIV